METANLSYLLSWLHPVWNVLLVALGIGLVIFVHELGHFAVAKWVGVVVERFSIGFGPILWSMKRGETEYALSAIPFGGYVKMLGEAPESSQDDNPGSYSNQSVPKRMAIISAGVVMNVLFGFIGFLIVFNIGMPYIPAVIGLVQPGGPAWVVGMERGDIIRQVNGKNVIEFQSFQQAVMLTKPGDERGLALQVKRAGKLLDLTVYPEMRELAPQIGVTGPLDLKVGPKPAVVPASAAARSTGQRIQPGDRITHVDDIEVDYPKFAHYLARHAADSIRVRVSREGDDGAQRVEVTIGPQYFRDLGLQLGMPTITAVRKGSPAARAKNEKEVSTPLQVGDKIKNVRVSTEDRSIDPLRLPELMAGLAADPLRLPDLMAGLAADESTKRVTIEIRRQLQESQGEQDLSMIVELEDRPAWIMPPLRPGDPLTVPALGIAYQFLPLVTEEPVQGSPAAKAGIKKDDLITGAVLETVEDPAAQGKKNKIETEITIDEETPGFPFLFWALQERPESRVKLKITRGDGPLIETKFFSPEFDPSWPSPIRGIILTRLTDEYPPQGFKGSVVLGCAKSIDTLQKIYLTLRRLLINRSVSHKALSGPVMILWVGYLEASMSIADLINFLAILSINLAVINFLPIPILDGGHMVFLAWEWIRGKRASERVLMAANYCGLMLIISLALFVTFQDVLRLVGSANG